LNINIFRYAEVFIFVDANYPAIRTKIDVSYPVDLNVTSEIWRLFYKKLPDQEKFSAFGLCGDVYVYPDDVYELDKEKVIWFHRNKDNRVWSESLKNQGLEHLLDEIADPIMNRTFGGAIVVIIIQNRR